MSAQILATKLFVPTQRPSLVTRSNLIKRVHDGLNSKLTLISAPAGFGKTTLATEWALSSKRPLSWLSLDEGDNDPLRFLTYMVSALQKISSEIGAEALRVLQSAQPTSYGLVLTTLLNEISAFKGNFTLVLDDYHVIDSKPIDDIITFLIEHMPSCMHLIIATREDPNLPIARLRARNQLNELRAEDLRFTPAEAAELINDIHGLNLSTSDIAVLEKRTEGWIAGLNLAVLSIRGHKDAKDFIRSFSGSHYFVLDYLMEEVMQQQPENIRIFLLYTSILDRLCGSLCDAVLQDDTASGSKILEYLEHVNLFIVSLDNERRWYRYHHLFTDLLRQQLQHSSSSCLESENINLSELHRRASVWYETNGFDIEAFNHAVAANDVDRAICLAEGKGMPLHFRGAVSTILSWLKSLPAAILDERPSLWVMYASAISMTGQTTGIEEKLQAAEKSLEQVVTDEKTRNLIGHIAAIRAFLAATHNQAEEIIEQSKRALENLSPSNLSVRTATLWKLGYAYQLKGNRKAAGRAYAEAVTASQKSGNVIINLSSSIGLGTIQEEENNLRLAAQTYLHALEIAGDPPLPIASEAYLGLARVFYQWDELDTAEQYAQKSIQLAQMFERTDRYCDSMGLMARIRLAQGDRASALGILAEVESKRHGDVVSRKSELDDSKVLTLIHQGNIAAVANLAQAGKPTISRARISLACGDSSSALEILEPMRVEAEEKGFEDEILWIMVVQSVSLHLHGEKDKAVKLLADALMRAEAGGFIRIFTDEGEPMLELLNAIANMGMMPGYVNKLLAALGKDKPILGKKGCWNRENTVIEPMSQRELEILKLIAQGLSNQEIAERLFLALPTVKGYNRNIFSKLQVQRRTEAVARARELNIL